MYYPIKSSILFEKLFPELVWKMPAKKVIYLTFDDGPTPDVSTWVLDRLKSFDAKATFFCLGKNVQSESVIYNRLLDEGHAVGNHSFSHKNGWKSTLKDYCEDILEAEKYIDSKLFRPPYGKIRSRQTKWVKEQGYHIIMWSIMPGDFDASISSEECWENIKTNTKEGSIIVLHDSVKSEKHLRYILPKTLEHFTNLGFEFKAIEL